MAEINLQKQHDRQSSIYIYGSIQNVLVGQPEAGNEKETFDAGPYKMGLGATSTESFDTMGEGILVDGNCYATVTDTMTTVGSQTFYTMLVSGIKNEENPNYTCGEVTVETEMYPLIASLYKQAKHTVVWRGLVKCSQINSMLLKKSPIYGTPIFDDKKEYLENKEFNEPTWVYLVGAYTSDELPDRELVEHVKERLFYVNPLDEKSEILTHTHGLLLSKEIDHSSEITNSLVTDAVHILNKNTVVTQVKYLELYMVDRVESFCKR